VRSIRRLHGDTVVSERFRAPKKSEHPSAVFAHRMEVMSGWMTTAILVGLGACAGPERAARPTIVPEPRTAEPASLTEARVEEGAGEGAEEGAGEGAEEGAGEGDRTVGSAPSLPARMRACVERAVTARLVCSSEGVAVFEEEGGLVARSMVDHAGPRLALGDAPVELTRADAGTCSVWTGGPSRPAGRRVDLDEANVRARSIADEPIDLAAPPWTRPRARVLGANTSIGAPDAVRPDIASCSGFAVAMRVVGDERVYLVSADDAGLTRGVLALAGGSIAVSEVLDLNDSAQLEGSIDVAALHPEARGVVLSLANGRGFWTALYVLRPEHGRLIVHDLTLGGAEGYGEYDPQYESYAVSLEACHRTPRVHAGAVELSGARGWSSLHVRRTDRWVGRHTSRECEPDETVPFDPASGFSHAAPDAE
jgi:hypothetical protein